MKHLTKKTVKGRVVTEFVALNPIPNLKQIQLDFPDDLNTTIEVQEWRMYFDRAANQYRTGVEVILLTPKCEVVLIAKRLAFKVVNNKAEYEACTLGMEALIALGVTEVEILGDSMLVINQATK